jgi:hypothetical protein
MEICSMKTALIQEDRLTEEHKQSGVTGTMPERIKYIVTAEEKDFKGNISVALNLWDEATKSVLLPATSRP